MIVIIVIVTVIMIAQQQVVQLGRSNPGRKVWLTACEDIDYFQHLFTSSIPAMAGHSGTLAPTF